MGTSLAPAGLRSRPGRRTAGLVSAALVLGTVLVGHGDAVAAKPVTAKPVTAKPVTAKPVTAATRQAPTPPPNPTDKQISAAAAAKSSAASAVGQLSGLIVGVDARISNLSNMAELAGEKYLEARWKLALARTAATKAQTAVTAAQRNYDNARAQFELYIATAYMNRSGDSSGLLTAANPNVLLERNDLSRYTSGHQLDAIGNMTRATVARANAVSQARSALALRTTLTKQANEASLAAGRAVTSATTQRVALVAQKGSYESQLTSAGEALTGLTNKRAAYVAWTVMEAKIQAEAARRAAIARAKILAAQAQERARLARVAAAQAQQRREQAASAARRAASTKALTGSRSSASSSATAAPSREPGTNSSSGTGSSGTRSSGTGSSGTGSSGTGSADAVSSGGGSPPAGSSNGGGSNGGSGSNSGVGGGSGGSSGSSGGSGSGSSEGSWTPAKGLAAVARAERWQGTEYSFAGGDASGPTYGSCVGGGNACHVKGFDCSGLSLYAWAGSGVYLDHFSVSQYLDAGSVHPSVDQLQPGDLTFWSTGGISGIHHVAIYIGNGDVIEAPHTGDVVRIVPLWMNGYYGATRPGT